MQDRRSLRIEDYQRIEGTFIQILSAHEVRLDITYEPVHRMNLKDCRTSERLTSSIMSSCLICNCETTCIINLRGSVLSSELSKYVDDDELVRGSEVSFESFAQ